MLAQRVCAVVVHADSLRHVALRRKGFAGKVGEVHTLIRCSGFPAHSTRSGTCSPPVTRPEGVYFRSSAEGMNAVHLRRALVKR